MTTLENLFFGNINPSEYENNADVKGLLHSMTKLTEELKGILSSEQQKDILERIVSCHMSAVALSERDAFINGYKLGTKMTTEVFLER